MAITEATPCWVCHASTISLVEYQPLMLLECQECGFVFQPLNPEQVRGGYDEEYFATYGDDDEAYEAEEQRRHEARVRLRLLREFRAPGRLLEIGSASGYFLEEAAADGWDPTGIEPCEAVAAAAVRRGTRTLTGFVEDIDLDAECFDVVCGWHVLEHIPDPLATVVKLRSLLKPTGLAVFEVPNFGCVHSRRYGPRWPYLDPGHHVNQFTPRSIARLFDAAGFTNRLVTTVPTRATYEPAKIRRRPRQIALQGRYMLATRSLGVGRHPSRFEMLRIVAEAKSS